MYNVKPVILPKTFFYRFLKYAKLTVKDLEKMKKHKKMYFAEKKKTLLFYHIFLAPQLPTKFQFFLQCMQG